MIKTKIETGGRGGRRGGGVRGREQEVIEKVRAGGIVGEGTLPSGDGGRGGEGGGLAMRRGVVIVRRHESRAQVKGPWKGFRECSDKREW